MTGQVPLILSVIFKLASLFSNLVLSPFVSQTLAIPLTTGSGGSVGPGISLSLQLSTKKKTAINKVILLKLIMLYPLVICMLLGIEINIPDFVSVLCSCQVQLAVS